MHLRFQQLDCIVLCDTPVVKDAVVGGIQVCMAIHLVDPAGGQEEDVEQTIPALKLVTISAGHSPLLMIKVYS